MKERINFKIYILCIYCFTNCFYNISDWDKRGGNQYVAYKYLHKYKRKNIFETKLFYFFSFLIVYTLFTQLFYIVTRNV